MVACIKTQVSSICTREGANDSSTLVADLNCVDLTQGAQIPLGLECEEEDLDIELVNDSEECVNERQSDKDAKDADENDAYEGDGKGPGEFEVMDIDTEITKALDEIDNLEFKSPVEQLYEPEAIIELVLFNEQDEYDAIKGDPLYDLVIGLGTDELPRYSCACHKANIAVRMSIKKSTEASSILAALSSFAGRSRKSINDSLVHIKEKSRIRVENATRWSSSYLMLESFKRCFDKKVFDDEYKPPVSQNKIETYLQILLPAYKFSTILQWTKSSIGSVVPLLLILIDTWKKMSLVGAAKQFRDFLVRAFEHKFEYELASNVYLAAAALDTSGLVCWFKKDFSERIVLQLDDCLKSCAVEMVKKQAIAQLFVSHSNQEKDSSSDSEDDGNLLSRMAKRLASSHSSKTPKALTQKLITKEIDKEISEYLAFLNQANLKKLNLSNAFWCENIGTYPYLGKLAREMLNIPASTAFIERYFSLCGVICNQRASNMHTDLITMRCMLKSNLSILFDDSL
jgi:hypothetical protein